MLTSKVPRLTLLQRIVHNRVEAVEQARKASESTNAGESINAVEGMKAVESAIATAISAETQSTKSTPPIERA